MFRSLLLTICLLVSFNAFSIDEKVIMNPKQDGDLTIKVNDGGVIKDAISVDGATGQVDFLEQLKTKDIPEYDSTRRKNFIVNGGFDCWPNGDSGGQFVTTRDDYSEGPARWALYRDGNDHVDDEWRMASVAGTLTWPMLNIIRGIPSAGDGIRLYHYVSAEDAKKFQETNTASLSFQVIFDDSGSYGGEDFLAAYIYAADARNDFSSTTYIDGANISSSISDAQGSYHTYKIENLDFSSSLVKNGLRLQITVRNDTDTTPIKFWIGNVMLNQGATAAPFQRAGGSVDGDIALCGVPDASVDWFGYVPARSDPIQMSNSLATKLGYYQYVGGQTYNSVDLDITGYGNTTTANNGVYRAVLIPYQMQDGSWRLRFNIAGALDVAASGCTVTIAGVTFKNTSNFHQAVSCSTGASSTYDRGRITANSSIINLSAGGNTAAYRTSGDVELESKPTWAY